MRIMSITAQSLEIGDLVVNVGTVRAHQIVGAFVIFTTRENAWSLGFGRSEPVTLDNVMHCMDEVWIEERPIQHHSGT